MTVSYYFYKELIELFLPFEARYVSLRGYKDYILINKVITFYFEYIVSSHSLEISKKEYMINYSKLLRLILDPYFLEYIDLLENKFGIPTTYTGAVHPTYYKYRTNKKHISAIIFLEKFHGISNNIKHNHVTNKINFRLNAHAISEIYKNEINQIEELHEEFSFAYTELTGVMRSNYSLLTNNKYYNELESLFFQVSHEFLAYLSHYSSAVVFFDTPTIYTTNLKRAIGHLRRAIMDIYEGLIIYEGISSTAEFLSMRTEKVASLGQNKKSNTLIKRLGDYYKKNSIYYLGKVNIPHKVLSSIPYKILV